jgi:hypothetical protein
MKTFKEIRNTKGFKVGLIIFGICIIIILFIIFLIINLDSEKTRINRLTKVASTFYSEFYYEQVATNDADRINSLQKSMEKGIVLTVADLSKFSNDAIFKEMSKECDLYKSRVIIYPKSPFSKISFDSKVELSCDIKANANPKMTTEKSTDPTTETTKITKTTAVTTKNEPIE